MPIVATANLKQVSPSPGEGERWGGRGGQGVRAQGGGPGEAGSSFSGLIFGEVRSAAGASFTGTISRSAIESFSSPALFYNVTILLDGHPVPASSVVGPVEFDETTTTPARQFTFTITGREYSIHHTEKTWTSTPVEIWVTAGPLGALRTERRAFGHILTAEQQEGPEPTLRLKCGDPSHRHDRTELCHEFLPGWGTRGAICREILHALGLTPQVPAGAQYTKPVITDSQRLWPFLQSFCEAESWSWRFTDWLTVEAYKVALREAPEPPDDTWTLRDICSITSAPPTDVPSQWVIRSTKTSEAPAGLKITKQRTEVFALYAIKKAIALQQPDGSHQPLPAAIAEVFQRVSAIETEIHERSGLVVAKITREWAWYNPRAAKLRTPPAGQPPGPVEGGFYWAQAFVDEAGACRSWRQESFVQTSERRELPTYDAEGTETARRIETHRWHSRAMGVRKVGAATLNVDEAAVGDDDLSWYPFEKTVTAVLRIEDYALAQLDEITLKYGESGAVSHEIQETTAWYTQRTPVAGVPWFVNASGAGQKDLVAKFQRVQRRTTTNTLTEDGLLAGTLEASQGFTAPRRVEGAFDYGDHKSNFQEETWRPTHRKTTIYNVLDENTYEEIIDQGEGATTRLIMGRAPRPRYRASPWTRQVQTPIETILEDETAAAWWGPSTEVLNLDHIQSQEEAAAVARARRSRRLAFVHTVIRPICQTRPGDTIHLIDPRTGLNHRCLVIRLQERWVLSPHPQILATYTLEQPL